MRHGDVKLNRDYTSNIEIMLPDNYAAYVFAEYVNRKQFVTANIFAMPRLSAATKILPARSVDFSTITRQIL